MTRPFLVALLVIGIVAACGAEPVASGPSADSPQGYLARADLPNSLTLLPPAPATGSAAQAYDEAVNGHLLELQGTPRWELAAMDANLRFPAAAGTFSCALGAPVTEEDTPALYRLLRRSMWDAGLSTYAAKNAYARPRPFVGNGQPTCMPEDEPLLVDDGAYPSGHAAVGWAWALILAEIAPERANEVLARGLAFGDSRMVCNAHWPNDVAQGRMVGAATVAVLHASEAFRADQAAARAELEAVRARALPPMRDCVEEARALAQPWQ